MEDQSEKLTTDDETISIYQKFAESIITSSKGNIRTQSIPIENENNEEMRTKLPFNNLLRSIELSFQMKQLDKYLGSEDESINISSNFNLLSKTSKDYEFCHYNKDRKELIIKKPKEVYMLKKIIYKKDLDEEFWKNLKKKMTPSSGLNISKMPNPNQTQPLLPQVSEIETYANICVVTFQVQPSLDQFLFYSKCGSFFLEQIYYLVKELSDLNMKLCFLNKIDSGGLKKRVLPKANFGLFYDKFGNLPLRMNLNLISPDDLTRIIQRKENFETIYWLEIIYYIRVVLLEEEISPPEPNNPPQGEKKYETSIIEGENFSEFLNKNSEFFEAFLPSKWHKSTGPYYAIHNEALTIFSTNTNGKVHHNHIITGLKAPKCRFQTFFEHCEAFFDFKNSEIIESPILNYYVPERMLELKINKVFLQENYVPRHRVFEIFFKSMLKGNRILNDLYTVLFRKNDWTTYIDRYTEDFINKKTLSKNYLRALRIHLTICYDLIMLKRSKKPDFFRNNCLRESMEQALKIVGKVQNDFKKSLDSFMDPEKIEYMRSLGLKKESLENQLNHLKELKSRYIYFCFFLKDKYRIDKYLSTKAETESLEKLKNEMNQTLISATVNIGNFNTGSISKVWLIKIQLLLSRVYIRLRDLKGAKKLLLKMDFEIEVDKNFALEKTYLLLRYYQACLISYTFHPVIVHIFEGNIDNYEQNIKVTEAAHQVAYSLRNRIGLEHFDKVGNELEILQVQLNRLRVEGSSYLENFSDYSNLSTDISK